MKLLPNQISPETLVSEVTSRTYDDDVKGVIESNCVEPFN